MAKKQADKKTTGKQNVSSETADDDDISDDLSFLDWSKAERDKYAKRLAEEEQKTSAQDKDK